MKFKVTKASDCCYEDFVEIKSIKALIDFIKKNGDIIIRENNIKIYDGYVE